VGQNAGGLDGVDDGRTVSEVDGEGVGPNDGLMVGEDEDG